MPKSEERENAWNGDLLRELHTLSLEVAQERVIDLIECGSTRPSKKAHLIRDIRSARSSSEVSRIMYNAMLAGSGLGIQGSAWQRMHGAAK